MTRLSEENIMTIEASYEKTDDYFINTIGYSLFEIGCYAMEKEVIAPEMNIACVPISTGLGEIGGFSQTVARILNYCGARAYVTDYKDVAGIQEAVQKKADAIFMADDWTFTAINLKNKRVSDNGNATGVGFAAALDLAAGSLAGKEVLVLGLGAVGSAGAGFLLKKNVEVVVYDTDQQRLTAFVEKNKRIKVEKNWGEWAWNNILDATPHPQIITENNVGRQTICAIPGIPGGLTQEAKEKCAVVIDNMLELGVVTMLCEIM